ncbi:diguanylate cyclase [Patescibacteria group bacterium]|nr:diguanylate cyclase [Patescibacteria group bacterium]
MERLKDSAALAKRVKLPFGVALIDVVNQKGFNEISHAVGDKALMTVSRAMETLSRTHEHPARIGGGRVWNFCG